MYCKVAEKETHRKCTSIYSLLPGRLFKSNLEMCFVPQKISLKAVPNDKSFGVGQLTL